MPTSPIRVLAVDDRADNLLSIQAALRSPDLEVVTAASGREALRYLLDNDCAVILLDVQMPQLDGFETADLIRNSPRAKETPIIFLTAINKEKGFVGKGYASGAVDYLFKPFEPEVLKAKVAVFAALHRSKREILAQAAIIQEHQHAEKVRALAELELTSMRRVQALQKRYQDLVNGIAHAVIWSAHPQSLLMSFVSPSAREILGYPLECWSAPCFFLDHVPGEERASVELQLRGLTKETPTCVVEHGFFKSDGSRAWLQTSVRAADSFQGGVELHGLSVDLTAQKEAESALRTVAEASREFSTSLRLEDTLKCLLRTLVPRLGDWCFIELQSSEDWVTLHGRAEPRWAPALEQLCQLPPEAFPCLTQPVHLRLVRDCENGLASIARSERQLQRLRELTPRSVLQVPLSTGERYFGRLVVGYSRRGSQHDDAQMLLVEELARRAAHAIDNAQLYRKLQESVRLREDFLSAASHELRTPLTSIHLHLSSLERTLHHNADPLTLSEEATRKVSAIRRQSDRLTRLVERLLDVSRIRTGRLDLQLEDLELEPLIQDVIGRFREELAREGIEVHLRLEQGLRGHWDRFRVDQVLTNLLSNAVKYGRGKPIDIAAREQDERVVLEVHDHGIGIEGPNPERVFRRFERASQSPVLSGLGLGLYIVQQLVQAHGGTVHVKTQTEEGSTFTVELPKTPPPRRDERRELAT